MEEEGKEDSGRTDHRLGSLRSGCAVLASTALLKQGLPAPSITAHTSLGGGHKQASMVVPQKAWFKRESAQGHSLRGSPAPLLGNGEAICLSVSPLSSLHFWLPFLIAPPTLPSTHTALTLLQALEQAAGPLLMLFSPPRRPFSFFLFSTH